MGGGAILKHQKNTKKKKLTLTLTLNLSFFEGAARPPFPRSKKPERAGAAASLPSPVYRGRPPLPFDFLLPLSSRQQTHSPLSFKTKPEQPLRSPKPQIFPLSPEKPVKPRTRRYPQTIPTFPLPNAISFPSLPQIGSSLSTQNNLSLINSRLQHFLPTAADHHTDTHRSVHSSALTPPATSHILAAASAAKPIEADNQTTSFSSISAEPDTSSCTAVDRSTSILPAA